MNEAETRAEYIDPRDVRMTLPEFSCGIRRYMD